MTMQEVEVEVEEATPDTELNIPVVKAKTSIKVNTGKLPEHVYTEAVVLGLKQLINRGQTKFTKEQYPDPEQLREVAMEKAKETLEALYAGKVRIIGAKADKIPGAVMTEARRIARNLVKENLKMSGVKISLVEASEITKAANALIAAMPELIEKAEEEIDKRKAASTKLKVDVVGLVPISQKKLKAAEAKKAEKVLSAKKAGMVETRGRPQPRA